MSEWPWVVAGYAITYLALGGYLLALVRRGARARRRAEELE